MSLIPDLLASLPEDRPVQGVYTCVFWTAVVAAGRAGLASTTPPSGPPASQPVRGLSVVVMRLRVRTPLTTFGRRRTLATRCLPSSPRKPRSLVHCQGSSIRLWRSEISIR